MSQLYMIIADVAYLPNLFACIYTNNARYVDQTTNLHLKDPETNSKTALNRL